ncbi:MAG TPA: FAD-dependent oxidoreductase [Polyangiaceae bacterium]
MTQPLPDQIEIDIGRDEPDDDEHVRRCVLRRLRCPSDALGSLSILRRAIDARGGRIRFHLLIGLDPALSARQSDPGTLPRSVSMPARVAIVGDGPAGLFAAYELARRGIASIVFDRGKTVQPRRADLVSVLRRGHVDLDSNYCFGEGGAGTYSDGKLYTRATKRGDVREVLAILAAHGAPDRILVDARPHIGSNRLPKVVSALRERLEQVGVEFRFGQRVTGIEFEPAAGNRRVAALRLRSGETVAARAVVLATGHSARDVYTWLHEAGVRLEAKPFAVGVRIEHPQALINRIQYGGLAEHPRLPNADYRLAFTEQERGVFSFCMCPGGFIVPAATESDGVVVNGMSLSRRDSPFANSGMVVGVDPSDLATAGYSGPLAGLAYQRALERAAYVAGGGGFRAPASRVTDFMQSRVSKDLPKTSYRPGIAAFDLAQVLDAGGVPIAQRLRRALAEFGRQMRGYVTDSAVLIGVETRTSSPVRVPRDTATLQHPDVHGLYPCGEGGGHAGGIVSAAMDGIRVAQAIASDLRQPEA